MALSSVRAVLKARHLLALKSTSLRMSTKSDVVAYEEIKKLIAKPSTNYQIIDVREPEELKETGFVPTSINIPLGDVKEKLSINFPEEQYQKLFGKNKPDPNTPLIFMCKIGKRSQKALEIAQGLGYKNARNYLGSWTEWQAKEGSSK